MEDLVELVIKASEELQSLPGDFEVDLELHWLPSHGTSVPPDDRVRLHDLVDHLAAHSRKDREDIFDIDRRRLTPEPRVFASLKNPLLVPPLGFLALFHPAEQGVNSALISTHRELEVRQLPGLVQREHDIARKEGHLDGREERLAEVRQDLNEEKDAISQAKKELSDERKAMYEKEKALGEGEKALDREKKALGEGEKALDQEKRALGEGKRALGEERNAMYEEKRALAEEKKVMAQKYKEQRETEQGLMDRERAVTKAEAAPAKASYILTMLP